MRSTNAKDKIFKIYKTTFYCKVTTRMSISSLLQAKELTAAKKREAKEAMYNKR